MAPLRALLSQTRTERAVAAAPMPLHVKPKVALPKPPAPDDSWWTKPMSRDEFRVRAAQEAERMAGAGGFGKAWVDR